MLSQFWGNGDVREPSGWRTPAMPKPADDNQSPSGGPAAERLREFLRARLPPGSSLDKVNPAIPDEKTDTGQNTDQPKEKQ
jgi:hypothetical protein